MVECASRTIIEFGIATNGAVDFEPLIKFWAIYCCAGSDVTGSTCRDLEPEIN